MLMQAIHHFSGPSKKGAAFHGWAGPITEWVEKSAPKVNFGNWKRDSKTGGGTVTFECQPFQICMYGANSKEMAVRDKFTYFAFAGLGADGKLRLQKLPEGTVAREVFTAGGWTPPSIDNLVNRIEALSDLDFKERLDEAVAIVKLCCEGYGLDCHLLTYVKAGTANKLDAISTIFLGLAGWPQLSDVALAIQVFLETYEQEWKNRQKHSAAEKQAAFNKTVSEMQASGRDISPLSVAAWMMGFKDLGDKIPHEAKERARKLKKEFRNSFGGETSVEID